MPGLRGERSTRVVVFAGHLPDAPDRVQPRFPAANIPRVARAIANVLAEWEIGPGDRCLCGGARGGDLLFAEACLAVGAEVALLLALPLEAFIARSVEDAVADWTDRFRAVVQRSTVRVLALEEPSDASSGSPFGMLNAWLLEVGIEQAAPNRPYILVLWDGIPSEPGRPGTGDFALRARAAGLNIRVIDPANPHE